MLFNKSQKQKRLATAALMDGVIHIKLLNFKNIMSDER